MYVLNKYCILDNKLNMFKSVEKFVQLRNKSVEKFNKIMNC